MNKRRIRIRFRRFLEGKRKWKSIKGQIRYKMLVYWKIAEFWKTDDKTEKDKRERIARWNR